VVTFGFSVLGRYPFLVSPEFPRGRLQPHLGIGPAIFITSWDDQEGDTNENVGSETVVNGGLQFLGGISYFIFENVAAFAEYKFTHHVTQIGGVANTFSLVGNQPFNVSHFTFGVTYHFY
jgi:opacity protein-like surface antigen